MRGALPLTACARPNLGIIPACAGSTTIHRFASDSSRDHPRMCGEHAAVVGAKQASRGSSPHVRGARCRGLPDGVKPGIIPACAGSTWMIAVPDDRVRDHPRMCGEHSMLCRWSEIRRGSSPHVRGARGGVSRLALATGIIPACAGSTNISLGHLFPPWDHPRMCGEHFSAHCLTSYSSGSSPHVRGAPPYGSSARQDDGIIPACAGST